MASSVFIDTSGLYAISDHRDAARDTAVRFVRSHLRSRRRFVLTDYIIDESATLARARAGAHGARRLLELVEQSVAFDFIFVGAERFAEAKNFFLRHADHGYSFTDCTSFIVMKDLRLSEALTTDRRFNEAGFKALLA